MMGESEFAENLIPYESTMVLVPEMTAPRLAQKAVGLKNTQQPDLLNKEPEPTVYEWISNPVGFGSAALLVLATLLIAYIYVCWQWTGRSGRDAPWM